VIWTLKVSLESNVTPRYLSCLVQGMYSLNNLTGLTEPRRWVRRLENKVTVDFWVIAGGTNRLLSFDATRTAWKTTRPTVLLLRVYLLPQYHFHQADKEIFTRHAVEIGIAALIYIPSFMKTGSDIRKLIGSIRHSMAIVSAYFNFFK
jgi:hypothetical protein